MYAKQFENAYYSGKWEEKVPGTDNLYRMGTYSKLEGDGYVVYDGAENLMGYVYEDGSYKIAGASSVYKASFIVAAAAAIKAEGEAAYHD